MKRICRLFLFFCIGSSAWGQVPANPPTGTALTNCRSITRSGNYYLTRDVACTAVPFGLNADHIVLNLNAHTVSFGSAAAVVPAFAICDAWYKDLKGCSGSSHHAAPEIYGGTVVELPDAHAFTPVFWIGQASGLSGGKIHDLTATFDGAGSQFVHGDYCGTGWRIYNNVINDRVTQIAHPGQGLLSARSQFQGDAIYLNDGENAAGRGDRIYGNTINGSPQGGIQTTAQHSEIDNNVITLSSVSSNDYGITVLADGQMIHDNKILGRGRGLDGESKDFVFAHNTIDVHEEKNNAEYNGCELAGADGIRVKNYSRSTTGWSITGNTITVEATYCPAVGLRFTDLGPAAAGTIAGNSFTTVPGAAPDYPLSFSGDNRADLKFSGNTFSGSSIHIDWDGANETVPAGQIWKLTGPTVQDLDGQKAGAGADGVFPQSLSVADSIAGPTVECGPFAIAQIQLGTFRKHCGQ